MAQLRRSGACTSTDRAVVPVLCCRADIPDAYCIGDIFEPKDNHVHAVCVYEPRGLTTAGGGDATDATASAASTPQPLSPPTVTGTVAVGAPADAFGMPMVLSAKGAASSGSEGWLLLW